VEAFVPSHRNRRLAAVLALCDGCPVRLECRDDMLSVEPRGPAQIVAGGWRWYRDGRATPHRDDIGEAGELIATATRQRRYRALVPRV
jgi:hypothetical protein